MTSLETPKTLLHNLGWFAALVLLVLGLDGILGVMLPRRTQDLFREVSSKETLSEACSEFVNTSPSPWILLGDSVLAGDVVEKEEDLGKPIRVLDYLRIEKNPDDPAAFEQLAFDGLLLRDMRQLIAALDQVDPQGKARLMIEINPRSFSPHYAQEQEHSREWFGTLAPETEAGAWLDWFEGAWLSWISWKTWLRDHMPLYRLRHRFEPPLAGLGTMVLNAGIKEAQPREKDNALEGRMRVMEHFLHPDLSPESLQVQALREIVVRAATSRRRVFFFSSPLNRSFFRGVLSEKDYGDWVAGVQAIIEDQGLGEVKFAPLDSPLFLENFFIDHCHMKAEGNRLLALNLLHEANIRLAHAPNRQEIVYPEGPDETLVSTVAQGSCNGAMWQAAFRSPRGVAVQGHSRVVIADTGNHCLREMTGSLQVVRLLAGQPGKSGIQDGPAGNASLTNPISPCILGEAAYFLDLNGTLLRKCEKGQITTLPLKLWGSSALKQCSGRLYLLQEPNLLLEWDPATGVKREIARGGAELSFSAFTISPGHHLFLADSLGRIWLGNLETPLAIGSKALNAQLLFENTGTNLLQEREPFPYPFETVRLDRIAEMVYVEHYDGLLVLNDTTPTPSYYDVDEYHHLLFLDLAEKKVYPWLKPQVVGLYTFRHSINRAFVSSLHYGSLAYDQESGMLYYLERERSRLLRMGDGLWGTARIGNLEKTDNGNYDYRCARAVRNRFHPEKYLGERYERLPRKGPYIGLILGSSMTAESELVLQYSLARRLELQVKDSLGYRDGIRFDLIAESFPFMGFEQAIQEFQSLVQDGARIDALLIEIHMVSNKFLFSVSGNHMIQPDSAETARLLNTLSAAAGRYGTKVVFFDNCGLVAQNNNGLRDPDPAMKKLMEAIRGAGFPILDLSSTLLRDHLEETPWGSPPFGHNHASPLAIEATAALLSNQVYPILRDHFKDRKPAWREKERPMKAPVEPERLLSAAFDEVRLPWDQLQLPSMPPGKVQVKSADANAIVIVDAGGLTGQAKNPEDIALSVLYDVVGNAPLGRRTAKVSLSIVTFSNYDEYGLGVHQGATVLWERTFDRTNLQTFLEAAFIRHKAKS